MNYIDICTGIGAATAAWHPLGWQAVCYAEIERFPSLVLKHHYPDVPNAGDFTRMRGDEYGAVDLLAAGTPCQDFSVAGLRAGMDGARGQLTVEFARLADRLRSRWLVWENVPGVLSIDGGRAFGAFLGILGQLGYGVAYRVLNAQYAGVPQRRRRVFVVGHLGDWRRAAAVLFERHSLSGNPAPRREAGQGFAGQSARSVAIRGRDGVPQAELGDEVANAILTPNGGRGGIGVGAVLASTGDISHCLNAGGMGRQGKDYGADATNDLTPTLRAGGFDKSHANSGNWVAVAFAQNTRDEVREMPYAGALATEPGMKQQTYIRQHMAVRRLTPRECERLQGFPDDYTKISDKTADGPRYKALGNSMAVPVMSWLGRRIQMVEDVTNGAK